jgi:NAD(P)-dependent dehydrogenase (short-subunit alcohol dehydrogenase family)
MERGSGRVVVVTGAGSGIGRAAAHALGAAGFRVVLAGRTEAALRETAETCAGALVVPTDVTDAAAVDALFSRALDAFGRVDVLFNNAGTFGPSARVDEIADEDWDAVVAVNLGGCFRCARAAFRVMRDQDPPGGRIINNGSISAQVPRPWSAPYAATKHALTGLTKAIALDGRPLGIACGQIDVGNAATAMTGAFETGTRQADGSIAAEPTMDVRHAAEAVVHMASLPPSANVLSMTVMATGMPFVGRG